MQTFNAHWANRSQSQQNFHSEESCYNSSCYLSARVDHRNSRKKKRGGGARKKRAQISRFPELTQLPPLPKEIDSATSLYPAAGKHREKGKEVSITCQRP